jgi:hypothetical protein
MIKPKHVVMDRDRHGNERWYFVRRGYPKVRLPGPPGAPGFDEAYEDALTVGPSSPKLRRQPPPPVWRKGYVYFLRSGAAVKIGFSTRPADRMEALLTGMPGSVDLFITLPGRMIDERRLHAVFADYRLNGEWFTFCGPIRQAMAQAAAYGDLTMLDAMKDEDAECVPA